VTIKDISNKDYGLDERRELEWSLYQKKSKKELREVSIVFDLNFAAFGVICDKFWSDKKNEVYDKLLNEGFDNFIYERLEKEYSNKGLELDESDSDRVEKLKDFGSTRLVFYSLKNILDNSNLGYKAAKVGRKYLDYGDNPEVQELACKILRGCNYKKDAEKLYSTAANEDNFDSVRQKAIKNSLEIADKEQIQEIIARVFTNNSNLLINEVLDFCLERGCNLKYEFVLSCLSKDNKQIRMNGLKILFNQEDRESIQEVLEEVLDSKKYYYDVVNRIDKKLYAPEFIQEKVKKFL
jgi:hypothetical protein